MKLGPVALALLLGISTSVSSAADAPVKFSRVALLLPACELPGLTAAELRSALALDLRDEHLSLAPAGELAPSSDVLVSFETACDGASPLALRADFRGERYARTIELAEVPQPQRARALSLAVAELLSLFEHPPEKAAPVVVEPPPPVAPAPQPAPAPTPAPPPSKPKRKPEPPKAVAPIPPPAAASDRAPVTESSSHHWQLAVAPELRSFLRAPLWGGRALVRYRGFSVGGAFLTTSTSVPAGTVTTRTVHGLVGYQYPLVRWDSTALAVGARVGAGRTFLTAEASTLGRAIDAEDVYLDACATVRYSFRLSPRFDAGLGAELGYAGGPIGYADNEEIARTSGFFIGAAFDIALGL